VRTQTHKTKMKYKLTFALVASLSGSAFAAFQAPLPEFKNEKQLAEWRAEKASEASSQGYKAEETAFYTGKPYVDSSGGYAFKYRSYNPELARWTSEDPSGFPDGANGNVYAPTPNSEFDYCGLRSVTLLQGVTSGGVLNLSNQIGSATVSNYVKFDSQSQAGADITIATTISQNNGKIYRWRQHLTIKDQAGNFLDWQGKSANNLLDPYPADDNKDWYLTNTERTSYATANGGEGFSDTPRLNWSRITGSVTSITNSFLLELVEVNDINVANGGTVVLSVNWGYTMAE